MNKKNILLVEDNPDDVDLTIRAFKKNNIMNEIVVSDGQKRWIISLEQVCTQVAT